IAEVTDIVRIAEIAQSVPLLTEVAQFPEPEITLQSAPPVLEEPTVVIEPAPQVVQREESIAVVAAEPAAPAREEKEEREPARAISATPLPVAKSESQARPTPEKG